MIHKMSTMLNPGKISKKFENRISFLDQNFLFLVVDGGRYQREKRDSF